MKLEINRVDIFHAWSLKMNAAEDKDLQLNFFDIIYNLDPLVTMYSSWTYIIFR